MFPLNPKPLIVYKSVHPMIVSMMSKDVPFTFVITKPLDRACTL